ncbi:MAG: tRNA uridine-5-carboxymethylaminomethyl(34) synthesis GTPase MnmE [Bacteroidetes bacterium]|nr:tRNA uridine-5-carboxymethylaminomethyl(34) synthesis GTPase MnmE [Bacteroidota bacterium]
MFNKSIGYNQDTIVAVATPSGSGAISVIRLSGPNSLSICIKFFVPANKKLTRNNIESHKLYFGNFVSDNTIIDEVLVSYFKNPSSYTSEDVIEISCHGSEFIQQKILEILLDDGARIAEPGEFTLRAFINGRMDLSQAEAVADLIASQSASAHSMAMKQMRGGISEKINYLRSKLIDFASLIELELDFSEEDVEFANREQFFNLINELKLELTSLISSFSLGNVMKQGIPVAIIGKPNVGKSTLLNALLNEEKAIVSHIPGTTRDAIEDTFIIEGYKFRFIDTAGLRDSDDIVENIGIERTYEKIKQATIVLYVCDIANINNGSVKEVLEEFKQYIQDETKHFIFVGNKIDQLGRLPSHIKEIFELDTVFVSAKRKENIQLLTDALVKTVKKFNITNDVIVSNSRHYQALVNALSSIVQVEDGFNNDVPTDLIAIDIRHALHELGTITGQITTDDLLGNIFGKFCIGK